MDTLHEVPDLCDGLPMSMLRVLSEQLSYSSHDAVSYSSVPTLSRTRPLFLRAPGCVSMAWQGSIICTENDSADGLFFILHGSAYVSHFSTKVLFMESETTFGSGGSTAAHGSSAQTFGGSCSESLMLGGGAGRGVSTASRQSSAELIEKIEKLDGVALAKGAHFGEAAHMLQSTVLGVAAVSKSRCLLARVPKAAADALLANLPNLESKLMHESKQRLLESFRSQELPFFADLSDDMLRQAAHFAVLNLSLVAGHTLVKQAAPSDTFNVVLSGAVSVERENPGFLGPPVVWTLNPGQCFGEMPLLFPGTKSVATFMVGARGCSLLTLPRHAFLALFNVNTSLLAEVHIKILRDKCTLQNVLDHRRARLLFSQHIDRRKQGMSNCLAFHNAIRGYMQVCACAPLLVHLYRDDHEILR